MNDKSTENNTGCGGQRSNKLSRRRQKTTQMARLTSTGEAVESGSVLRRCRLPKRLTYSALIDKSRREIEITDFMVRRACDEIEGRQQFPFAPLPAGVAS